MRPTRAAELGPNKTLLLQRSIIALAMLSYVLPGIALLFAPRWFYDFLADFPPFNRHFMGDAGVFSFALGIGLLVALVRPAQQRLTLAVGALGGLLHVANHLYDDVVIDGGNMRHFLSNSLGLLIVAIALAWVAASLRNGPNILQNSKPNDA